MKTYKYKILSLLLLMSLSVIAQKHDKKVSEKFKVNPDVTVVINANHTDVDIQTWNKNVVSIEGFMEVEGATKEEAEEILKSWNFEAMVNDGKVKISSFSDRFMFEFGEGFEFNFDFDFSEMEFEMPEMEFEMPDIEFPEIEFPEMVFPEIEIPEMDLDIMEFDYEAYKKDSSYMKKYKAQVAKQVDKFKKGDWKKKMDSIRNSDEYKDKMKAFKIATEEMKVEMEKFRNSDEFKRNIEESKKVAEQVKKAMLENKDFIKEQTRMAAQASKMAIEASKMAKEMVEKMKASGKFEEMKARDENVYFNYGDDKNSKIKIKKYLKIMVPKNAKFDLNVKHGELNIPSSSTKI